MTFNNRILVVDDDRSIIDAFRQVLDPDQGRSSSQCKAEMERLLLGGNAGQTPALVRRAFQMDFATQGQEAVEKIKEAKANDNPYAVVFTDIRMPPGWDGVQTAQEIRRLDPAIGIIMVTAFSDASISEIVRQVGFTDRLLYLRKPFDDEEILQLADSLTMRWNLEYKVRRLSLLLERLLASFLDLEEACLEHLQNSELLLQVMGSVAAFLDTNDILLAKVQDHALRVLAGLGAYQDSILQTKGYAQIASGVSLQAPLCSISRVDKLIIIPVLCELHPKLLIARLPETEIEGADQLLAVLVKDSAKVLDIATLLASLRRSVDEKQATILALTKEIITIQQAT